MILYTINDLKIFEQRSDITNTDWTGKAEYIIDDNSPLAAKIYQYAPYFEYVLKDGVLIDIKPTERPVVEVIEEEKTSQLSLTERVKELEECLAEMASLVYGGEEA